MIRRTYATHKLLHIKHMQTARIIKKIQFLKSVWWTLEVTCAGRNIATSGRWKERLSFSVDVYADSLKEQINQRTKHVQHMVVRVWVKGGRWPEIIYQRPWRTEKFHRVSGRCRSNRHFASIGEVNPAVPRG